MTIYAASLRRFCYFLKTCISYVLYSLNTPVQRDNVIPWAGLLVHQNYRLELITVYPWIFMCYITFFPQWYSSSFIHAMCLFWRIKLKNLDRAVFCISVLLLDSVLWRRAPSPVRFLHRNASCFISNIRSCITQGFSTLAALRIKLIY